MTKPDNNSGIHHEMPLMQHLMELRDRLLRVVVVVFVLFIGLYAFHTELYELLSKPLIESLGGKDMIATDPLSLFFVPFKLSFFTAFLIAVPYVLHQAWAFISPGLYNHEKKFAFPLLASSVVLFYVGMSFAYFIVFPIVFDFLMGIEIEGVSAAPDINQFLNTALKLFFAFGVAFEVPIATVLLIWSGIATVESLKEKRPYIVVGAFVIGMLLTPPDAISQTLLAIPMWLLFEAGLFFSRFGPNQQEDENESDSKELAK